MFFYKLKKNNAPNMICFSDSNKMRLELQTLHQACTGNLDMSLHSLETLIGGLRPNTDNEKRFITKCFFNAWKHKKINHLTLLYKNHTLDPNFGIDKTENLITDIGIKIVHDFFNICESDESRAMMNLLICANANPNYPHLCVVAWTSCLVFRYGVKHKSLYYIRSALDRSEFLKFESYFYEFVEKEEVLDKWILQEMISNRTFQIHINKLRLPKNVLSEYESSMSKAILLMKEFKIHIMYLKTKTSIPLDVIKCIAEFIFDDSVVIIRDDIVPKRKSLINYFVDKTY